MDWFQLSKCFEERAHEVDLGVHGHLDKETRVMIMRDIAGAIQKMGFKEQKPFRIEKADNERAGDK